MSRKANREFPQQSKLNHILQKVGLAKLTDPRNLLAQLAMGVKNHDQFRELLLKVAPDKRADCYQAMKPRLQFEAKALDVYIAEGKNIAFEKKLPVYDHETGLVNDFDSVHRGEIERIAQDAVQRWSLPKKALNLTCRYCTFTQEIPGKDIQAATDQSERLGWHITAGMPVCPECVNKRRN